MPEVATLVSYLEKAKKKVLDNGFRIRENATSAEIDLLSYEVMNISQKIGRICSRTTGRMQAD